LKHADLNFLCHVPRNRPFDQLSRRTPAAIFKTDVRTDASLDLSSSFSRHNSVPTAHTALRKSSILYPFVFSDF
jgi:hypothetical protein